MCCTFRPVNDVKMGSCWLFAIGIYILMEVFSDIYNIIGDWGEFFGDLWRFYSLAAVIGDPVNPLVNDNFLEYVWLYFHS